MVQVLHLLIGMLNAPIRVFATVQLDCANAMMVILERGANALLALTRALAMERATLSMIYLHEAPAIPLTRRCMLTGRTSSQLLLGSPKRCKRVSVTHTTLAQTAPYASAQLVTTF